MKLCLDCKWCRREGVGKTFECHAPSAEEHRNMIHGAWPECGSMRSGVHYAWATSKPMGTCGIDAKWFEPKGVPNGSES